MGGMTLESSRPSHTLNRCAHKSALIIALLISSHALRARFDFELGGQVQSLSYNRLFQLCRVELEIQGFVQ
jgi:hypothetical protein